MAARRTDMHRLEEVVRLHPMGLWQRSIERELRMSRHTIGRALAAFTEAGLLRGLVDELPASGALAAALETTRPGPETPPKQQQSSVEAWRSDIERLWRQGAGATAIRDWLRTNRKGFSGSLSTVKQECAALRRAAGPDAKDIAIPLEI